MVVRSERASKRALHFIAHWVVNIHTIRVLYNDDGSDSGDSGGDDGNDDDGHANTI